MSIEDEFMERVNEYYRLGAIQSHLGWDQQTIMPAKGAESRADILSWLAKEGHNRLTDPKLSSLISQLEAKFGLELGSLLVIEEFSFTTTKSFLRSVFVTDIVPSVYPPQ